MERDRIKELQNIWQNQLSVNEMEPDTKLLMRSVLNKIKQTERKVFRMNLAKTIAIAVILVSFTGYFYMLGIRSFAGLAGITIIISNIIVMMILYWNIQFKHSSLKHELPQKKFVKDAIFRINSHKEQFARLFRWFVLFMIIGINILYLDLLKNTEVTQRIIFHVAISLFLVVVFLLGLKIRGSKFRKDFKPLIDELEAVNN